jgi:Ca2+-binding EF-hand superfamily protein
MNDVSNGNVELLKTELAKNLFKHYDRNHDGTINFKEFKKIANDFELNDDHKAKEMFDKIDTSGDHKVNSDGIFLFIII